MKWSEFKKKVEEKTKDTDPEIGFILFDIDYKANKIQVFLKENWLVVEG
jgi:hypothetical protein